MVDQGGVTYIAHEKPARRPLQSYIALVDLGPFGFADMYEQVWLQENDEFAYEMCCIPFRVYGLALGDQVELHDGKLVSRVVRRSGHRVLRVFFAESGFAQGGCDARQELIRELDAGNLLSEWSGDRHVAIDVPPDVDMRTVYRSVEHEINAGTAFWEWADSLPFETSLL